MYSKIGIAIGYVVCLVMLDVTKEFTSLNLSNLSVQSLSK